MFSGNYNMNRIFSNHLNKTFMLNITVNKLLNFTGNKHMSILNSCRRSMKVDLTYC